MFKIVKIFNNNAVLVVTEENVEKILLGKGIAFQKKINTYVDEDKIEKTFVVDSNKTVENFLQLIDEIPVGRLELVTLIIRDAEKELNKSFNHNTYIGLADHINYAIDRYKNGYFINNKMLLEIKKFYPKEYAASLNALKTIAYYEKIELNEDEAGFITLHFINGENNNKDTTILTTEMIHKVIMIVEDILQISLDDQSLNYIRFITHLKFFIQRIILKENRKKTLPEMYEQVCLTYPQAKMCVDIVKLYLQDRLECEIYPEEEMYLILHVQRLTK